MLNEEFEVRVFKKLKDLTPDDLHNICEDNHSTCNNECPIYMFLKKDKDSFYCTYCKNGLKMKKALFKEAKRRLRE